MLFGNKRLRIGAKAALLRHRHRIIMIGDLKSQFKEFKIIHFLSTGLNPIKVIRNVEVTNLKIHLNTGRDTTSFSY